MSTHIPVRGRACALRLALGLLALVSLPATAQQGSEELVPLRLTTNPAEATVNIDDAYAGESGSDNAFQVAPGPHEVVVYKEGFLVEVRSLDVQAGEPADLSIELAPDVAIPYGLSLARAPKFVRSEGDGMRYLVEVLDLVTEFHVSGPDGGDLMAHAFETVVGALDAIRRRESLLAAKYEPAVRERFYGKEVDLTAYPELAITRADDGPDVQFEVVAGSSRSTFSAPKAEPHRFALEFRGLRRFLFENWDSRALVSEDAFYFFAIQATIGRLDDPFTYFLSPRDVAEMKIDTTQQLGGLGMQVEKGKNGLVVIAPIEGTPAFEAGVLAGDVIVRIGDETTRDMPLETAVGKLRGEPGTQATFTIQRPGTPEPIVMTLTRAIFKIRSVKARMLPDGIGYIRLVSFMGEKVAEEFEAALSGLEKDGARALVIDLRSNPGGLMTTALAIVDLFVEDGMIFEVRARVPQLSEKHEAKREGTHPHVPTVVLVNGGSASASEIVAGILQSKGLATVVGQKTFGKGSVQRVLPLGDADGPALGLTIALYYLLGERPVHKIGIEPDHVVEVTPEQEAALARQSIYSTGEEKVEDSRLEKAIEVLKAKLAGK